MNKKEKDKLLKGGAFKKLKKNKHFEDIYTMMITGWTIPKIIKWLHAHGQFKDMKEGTLKMQLYRMRNALPSETFTGGIVPPTHSDKIMKAEEQLDEVKELGWLYQEQKERVKMGVDYEKKLDMPVAEVSGLISLAESLLTKSAKVKIETGVTERAPQQIDVRTMNVTASIGEKEFADILGDGEARGRILSALKIATEVDEAKRNNVIDVEPEEVEDGNEGTE